MNLPKRYNSYSEVDGKFFIPSLQRDLMPVQVSKMREHIKEMKSQNEEPIFGAIDIVEFNNKMYCIDGQHRLKALELEYKENNLNIPFTCMIYQANSKEKLQLIFKIRNMNIPLPDYLVSSDNDSKKELLKEIQKNISVKKGFELSKSSRPYINITNYMNQLSQSKIINILTNINDFNKMYDYINTQNKKLIADEKYRKKNKISDNMINKWYEFDNYNGIDLNFPWFSTDVNLELIDSILRERNSTISIEHKMEDESKYLDTKRKKFSQIERQKIWHTYIGSNKGQVLCPLCRINTIEPLNYVVGHVLSLNNGGSNDISNLRPICSLCNNSMATKDMDINNYSIEGI